MNKAAQQNPEAKKTTAKRTTAKRTTARKRPAKNGDEVEELCAQCPLAKAAPAGAMDTCEACHTLFPRQLLRPDRRAGEHGVGHKLCPNCLVFIAEVADRDYVWCVTEMQAEDPD